MLALRPTAALGTLLMVAALSGAWAFQVFGGYVPCALCLEQRIGYYAAIPLALLALAVAGRSEPLARVLLAAAAAAMLWSAGLGVYHAGAEWAFWPGPTTCGGGAEVRDASVLLDQLRTSIPPSCDQAAGRFLGLSFAGWNVVAAGASALLLAAAAVRRRPA